MKQEHSMRGFWVTLICILFPPAFIGICLYGILEGIDAINERNRLLKEQNDFLIYGLKPEVKEVEIIQKDKKIKILIPTNAWKE